MVTRPRLWLKTTSEKGPHLSCVVFTNRNDMSGALNSSDWVVNSKGKVISRGVTSCAGMTAQHVLLAQTKIGFLTGGRGYSFQELSPEEKLSQEKKPLLEPQYPCFCGHGGRLFAAWCCITNQGQSQLGSGASTLSLLTCATHGRQ